MEFESVVIVALTEQQATEAQAAIDRGESFQAVAGRYGYHGTDVGLATFERDLRTRTGEPPIPEGTRYTPSEEVMGRYKPSPTPIGPFPSEAPPSAPPTEAPPIKLDVELHPIKKVDIEGPAVLEYVYGGPPPQGYDVAKAQEMWKEAVHQKVMWDYATGYEKEPHPSPEELAGTGKALQLQYEHWKEAGQLEPEIAIPEDVWKEMTKKGWAERIETAEGITYQTKPGFTYAQVLEAYGTAGREVPQKVESLADFNARVQQYLKDVRGRETYVSFKEQIKEDPMMTAWRVALFPVTFGVGIGVGIVKGGTFGLVGREIPGGYEMIFGAGEKLVRGGEEPEIFTTRERAEQFAATPELSVGVTIGETIAFWGWGRIFGKVGGAVVARAGPKATKILTLGEVTAPKATQMFRIFGKVVTAPARGIKAVGRKIYTGAVGRFERVTGKTVMTQRRAGELVAAETLGGRVDVGPAALRGTKIQWASLWKPGQKVVEVPYLEAGKVPKMYMGIQAGRGVGYAEQAMMARITGKKLVLDIGMFKGIEPIAPSADVTATLVKGLKSATQQYGYQMKIPIAKTGGPWAGGLQQIPRTALETFSPSALQKVVTVPTFPVETTIGEAMTRAGAAIFGVEAAALPRIFTEQRLAEVSPTEIEGVGFRGITETMLKPAIGTGVGIRTGFEVVPTTAPAQAVRMAQQAMTKTVTEAMMEVAPSPFAKTAALPSQLFMPPIWFGGAGAGGGPRGRRPSRWLHLRRAREMGDPMEVFFGIKGWPRVWTEAVRQVRVPMGGRMRTPVRIAKRGVAKKKLKKVFG